MSHAEPSSDKPVSAELEQRLAVARKIIASGPQLRQPDDILRQRASQLAQTRQSSAPEQPGSQLLIFTLARENYGIATRFIKEVAPLEQLTPVPGTPAFVIGIVNHYGRIYSLVDLREFFGLPQRGISQLNRLIVLADEAIELAIVVDAIIGIREVAAGDIFPVPPELQQADRRYLQGITANKVIIIDIGAVLADPNLIVDHNSK